VLACRLKGLRLAKILIIDDEPDFTWSISKLLQAEGYRTLVANDGIAGLELVTKERPDLILLDFRLPIMDGEQILEKIREKNKTVPVIMVTGYPDTETAVKLLKKGASDYINKPFENAKLIKIVYDILRKPQELPKEVSVPRRLGIFFWLTSLVFLLAVSYFTVSVMNQKEKLFVFDVNTTHIAGMFWETTEDNTRNEPGVRGYLWLADWYNQKVYRYKVTSITERMVSANVEIYELPGVHPVGLVVTRNSLWICDSWSKRVFQYTIKPVFTKINEYVLPGYSPTGLGFDGTDLWSCDTSMRALFRHRIDSDLTLIGSYRSPGEMPVGVGWDGENIWSVDAGNRRVYIHDVNKRMAIIKTIGLEKIPIIMQPISGFTVFNNSVWITYESVGKLFQLKYDVNLIQQYMKFASQWWVRSNVSFIKIIGNDKNTKQGKVTANKKLKKNRNGKK